MNKKHDNVVLFPKWKETLETESMQALEEKRYEDALGKLNELLSLDESSHEILIGKLICLMELGKSEQAEALCLQLIANKDEHYFEYIHMYSTLLFQLSHYEDLIYFLDDLFYQGGIPEPIKGQLRQLYEISKKLHVDYKEEQGKEYIDQLLGAVEANDSVAQWRAVLKCKDVNINRYVHLFANILRDENIDAIVKSEIVLLLHSQEINESIEVHKFNQRIYVNPAEMEAPYNQPLTLKVRSYLSDIEQNNPSLFELIEQLLHRYVYVCYPFLPSEDESYFIAMALKHLGYHYLGLSSTPEVDEERLMPYIEQIIDYDAKYYAVIED